MWYGKNDMAMRRLLGLALIVVGLLVAVATIGRGFIGSFDLIPAQEVTESTTLPLDGIREIEVDSRSTAVAVTSTSADQIQIELQTAFDRRSLLETKREGDRLTIDAGQRPFQFVSHILSMIHPGYKEELRVAIPRTYHDALTVDASSGSVTISGLEGLTELFVDISSGEVNIEQVTTDDFRFDGSSGQLTVRDLKARSSEIDVSSGKVTLEKMTGEIKGDASSGSVLIDMERLDAPIRWSGSSGSITLRLPEDASFALDAETSSGSIHSDFPIMVHSQSDRQLKGTVAGGNIPIELRVSSGSINIERRTP
jgi:lia operon protein LiaG